MLKKTVFWASIATMLLLWGAQAAGLAARDFLNWRALLLVSLYAAVVMFARYDPGVCLYRIVVLDEPHKHFPAELERATSFAEFAGTRLLFAGLIFTLADIAIVLSTKIDATAAAPPLAVSLLAALYAMVFYSFVSHASRAARARAGA